MQLRRNDVFRPYDPERVYQNWSSLLLKCGRLLKRRWVFEAGEEFLRGEKAQTSEKAVQVPEIEVVPTAPEIEEVPEWSTPSSATTAETTSTASSFRVPLSSLRRVGEGVLVVATGTARAGFYLLRQALRTRRTREGWFRLLLHSLRDYAPVTLLIFQNAPIDYSLLLHSLWEQVLGQ